MFLRYILEKAAIHMLEKQNQNGVDENPYVVW